MDAVHVVTCFLRQEGSVLLLRRSGAVGSYSGRWGAVAGHVAPAGTDPVGPPGREPEAAAREEIAEETGLEEHVALVRTGEPFTVEDPDREHPWRVHPFLFDCDSREVTPNEETAEWAWVAPTEILRRETVPSLWESYDAVRPTPRSVRTDREHGAAWLSVRALECLRDEAALRVERGSDGPTPDLRTLAGDLADSRPAMPAVGNRVNRAMAGAADGGDLDAAAVERAASDGLARAFRVDGEAADAAAEALAEADHLLILSRSGTVREALVAAAPATVTVLESRPGGEGKAVAADLAAATNADVTLIADAAAAHWLATAAVDAVLVGADALLPDGRLVNKVGTRGVALAAARERIPTYAVAATDKVSPDGRHDLEAAPAEAPEGVTGAGPLFDRTPADAYDGVFTEDGLLAPDDIEAVAADLRALGDW
jgi:translation initiation factor 2B subunit (eIF-2B alpha/beta/delta family)